MSLAWKLIKTLHAEGSVWHTAAQWSCATRIRSLNRAVGGDGGVARGQWRGKRERRDWQSENKKGSGCLTANGSCVRKVG